ncbi:MAG: cytochrome-c peroxidase [Xanthomonadaceae bacterium]|nr:cytochrome-c peroxidase [Xanthomonadaceae bacterium]
MAALVLLAIAALALDARGGIGLLGEQLALLRTPSFTVPDGWPQPVYDFRDNPITAAGFALGRELFYDPRLSRDGSIACASCHQQFAAFAHYDHPVSHGIGNRNGSRNAPGLYNLAWLPQLMWDGSAHNLEVQPLGPIANPVEMDARLPDLLDRLRADPHYRQRFEAAFGTPDIDSQRMLRALAQFTGTLLSADSRYDRYLRGDTDALAATEQAGLAAFRRHCSACHAEPLFSDFSYRDNGLDALPRDAGRATVTARDDDRGRFRVPSLRNIGLSPPYMHDGRFDTLAQVVDHYRSGVAASERVDPVLRGGLPISDAERSALLAFLNTLDDPAFTHDVRFADPARRR